MTRILYYACFAVGLLGAVLLNGRVGARLGENRRDVTLYTLAGFTGGVIGAGLMSLLYNAVIRALAGAQPVSVSTVSIYGGLLLLPFLVPLFSVPAKKTYYRVMDTCAPGVFALLSCGKIGCSIYGCCYGIETANGVLNPFTGRRHFPVQLAEAVFTLALTALLYFYAVNRNRPKNAVYPLGLLLYAVGRFGLQFLRFHEVQAEENLLLFLDFWQIVSLVAAVIAGVWLFAAYRRLFHDRNIDRNGSEPCP